MRGIFYILLLVLAGCATTKVPQATGGSRSDGVIDLSYEIGMFEEAQVDWNAAQKTATERCAAWGYSDAEPFGGKTSKCIDSECYRELVTLSYQCTGGN